MNVSVIVNFTYVTDVTAFSVFSVTDVSVFYFLHLAFKRDIYFMPFLFIRPGLFNFPFYDICVSEDYPFSLVFFFMLIFYFFKIFFFELFMLLMVTS